MKRIISQEDFLRSLRAFELGKPSFRVWTLTFGEHKSRHAGQGLEFKEYRPYEFGEDLSKLNVAASLRTGQKLVRENLTEEKVRYAVVVDDSPSMQQFGLRDTAFLAAGCFLLSAIKARDPVRLVVSGRDEQPFVSETLHTSENAAAAAAEFFEKRNYKKSGNSSLVSIFSGISETIRLSETRILLVSDFSFPDVDVFYDHREKTLDLKNFNLFSSSVSQLLSSPYTELAFIGVAPRWERFWNCRGFFRFRDLEDGSRGLRHFTKKRAAEFVRKRYERERVWCESARLLNIPMGWLHSADPDDIINELEKEFSA